MSDYKFNQLAEARRQLESVVGLDRLIMDDLDSYTRDHTEDLHFVPDLVIQPLDTQEVSMIASICNEYKIPITVRGAGTGLSGGCLPVLGGVLLDMKRMNKVLSIDTDNFQVTTQPGVIVEDLQSEVAAYNLFYPVDPASKGSCFIGGNVAENAGGPRALKYGVTKDYVLNLEIVLADGSVLWTGANTLKNATGYNLTQLMVGSEGTLAIITQIVLKLIPLPKSRISLWVPFYHTEDASSAVNAIFMSGMNPSALEFMERTAVILAQEYLDDHSIKLEDQEQAFLLIEFDGNDRDRILEEVEVIPEVLSKFDTGSILLADSHEQQEQLWHVRRSIGLAVKSISAYKEEDTVVPRACLPQLLTKVKMLESEFGFNTVCYGHAGDGNLHINILKGDLSDEVWRYKLPKAIRILFEYVKSLGGTISGEHGIGLVQKEYMDIVFAPRALQLMAEIKRIFDPNHILNPGKIFPD